MKAPRTLAASNFRLRSASARSQSALDRYRWRDAAAGLPSAGAARAGRVAATYEPRDRRQE